MEEEDKNYDKWGRQREEGNEIRTRKERWNNEG